MTSTEHAPTVVEQPVLDDLRASTPTDESTSPPASDGRGVDGDYLANLVAYWADSYNWREHKTRLRSLPWVLTGENDTPIRAVHLRAAEADAVPGCSFTVGPTRSCASRRSCPCCPTFGDSPAGLAASILEKLRTWTDCCGDVETVL